MRSEGFDGTIVGLTGEQNVKFAETLDCYDSVVPYGDVETIDNAPAAYIDIAGNVGVRSRLHHHLNDSAVCTLLVGATHWDQFAKSVDSGALPDNEPEVFFAPAQIAKRDTDWGRGVMMGKAYTASIELLHRLSSMLVMESHAGVEACNRTWQALLDNQVSGQCGVMLSLRADA